MRIKSPYVFSPSSPRSKATRYAKKKVSYIQKLRIHKEGNFPQESFTHVSLFFSFSFFPFVRGSAYANERAWRRAFAFADAEVCSSSHWMNVDTVKVLGRVEPEPEPEPEPAPAVAEGVASFVGVADATGTVEDAGAEADAAGADAEAEAAGEEDTGVAGVVPLPEPYRAGPGILYAALSPP
jgi:hypothetical protein